MTIPFERSRAVLSTKEFLQSLVDPKTTPRVPRHIRRQAMSLLRHYPNSYDLETVEKNWGSDVVECPFSTKF